MDQLDTTRVELDEIVKLNIGGSLFQCYQKTLLQFPESRLANLDKNHNYFLPERNEYFFDRNPILFTYIIDGYRKGSLHLPKDVCGATLKDELTFWQLSASHVAPCCWEVLYKGEDEVVTMETLVENFRKYSPANPMLLQKPSMNVKIWMFLDEPRSSRPAMGWCVFISTLIGVSALIEALSTLSYFQVEYDHDEKETLKKLTEVSGWHNSSVEKIFHMKPHPFIKYGDFVCHCVLTLEFFIGFLVCPKKRAFFKSPLRFIILFGYVAYWVEAILEQFFAQLGSVHLLRVYLVLRYLTILMLGRLFYITKQIPSFQLIGLTFRSSKEELKILGFMLGILVCLFGFIMFVSELFFNDEIQNVFTAMYWALITLTTVGYGRYYPTTVFGHVTASACALCGVIVLALPIGIMASTFYTFYNYHKYASKHLQACEDSDRKQSRRQSNNMGSGKYIVRIS